MPEIGGVLDRLARLPGTLLARMSGSGATCFALFADRSMALIGKPGEQQLVFLDSQSSDFLQ